MLRRTEAPARLPHGPSGLPRRGRAEPRPSCARGPRLLPLALLLACGHAPPGPAVAADPADAHPAPASSDSTQPAPASSGISQPRAAELTGKIMDAVSAARSLPVTGKVDVAVLSRTDVRTFAQNSMYEHHSRDEIALFTRIESSLGILPVGADGERILLDMLELGVMGIYEPKNKSMLIGTHVSEAQLDMVVGHEIAHGLQDMHFDLQRLQQPIRGDSDAETARTFLVEGDAQAAYLAWVSGPQGLQAISPDVLRVQGDQTLSLASALEHPVLIRSLQLPYTDGAATVAELVRSKGWAAVDALYRELPTTSEQMLHLDKLLAREPATAISIELKPLAAALPDHALVWQDTIGEATFLCMLADVESAFTARAAAAGWGGDRLLVFDRKGKPDAAPLTVSVVAWDTEADAVEFEAPFREYLKQKMPGRFLLQRRGAKVLFATEVPPDLLPALARDAWTAFYFGAPAKKGKPA